MGQSKIHGKGIFAKVSIKENEVCVVFGGEYTNAEGAAKARTKGKLVMRWDEDLYSVEDRGDDPSYFINHSCDPNIWMNDAFTLATRRHIRAGEEITADYALWEAEEDSIMMWECKCSSLLCCKKITGKDWRILELQKRYRGHFSPLLNKRIDTFEKV
jgi:SET domain-containing protein